MPDLLADYAASALGKHSAAREAPSTVAAEFASAAATYLLDQPLRGRDRKSRSSGRRCTPGGLARPVTSGNGYTVAAGSRAVRPDRRERVRRARRRGRAPAGGAWGIPHPL